MIFDLSSISNILATVLEGKIPNKKYANVISTAGNITTLLGDYIIEPAIVVTEKAKRSSEFTKLIKLQTKLFISVYTSAFNVMVNIEGIEPKVAFKILSSNVNPKRRLGTRALDKLVEESDDLSFIFEEDEKDAYSSTTKPDPKQKESGNFYLTISVKISHEGRTLEIPIIFKPTIIELTTENMLDYASLIGDSHSFTAQLHRYKSGRISMGDFIFARNLLSDIEKKELKSTTENTIDPFEELSKRKSFDNHTEAGLGFNRSYGALIISSSEKNALKTAIKADYTKPRNKNKLLSNIASLNLCVIEDAFEFVSIYMYGEQKGTTHLTYSELLQKSTEDSFADVFKELTKKGGF